MKAVAAGTDATNMADSSAVLDATKVVDEGTSKKIPGERNCTNRQKALAAEKDVTHMAEPTLVPDATKVVDQGTTKRIPAKRKSRNSQQGNTVEARSNRKNNHALSSASSENPPGVARDFEALDVSPATSVADAVVVTSEGRGKGMGETSKSQKFSQVDAAGARRPDECKKRETSPFDTLGETDAQYLAEVAETDAVLAAYKRRRSERRLRGWHAGEGPVS